MINAFLLIVLLPTFSYAIEIEFSPEVTQTFKPTNCENNSTCDLEKFKMTTQTYKVKAWEYGDTDQEHLYLFKQIKLKILEIMALFSL